jgi:hypothetical protein
MDVDTALSEVPVNIMALVDDDDFVTLKTTVAYNEAGMALKWNFITTAGAYTQTAVTPTTSGTYDWASQGNGMYSIEIPASGGASINNDTEGVGWFTGVATDIAPWRSPFIGFRAAAINNSLVDGTTIDVNVTAVSGDSTAADNIEADYDGTGYAKSNSSLGSISGDVGGLVGGIAGTVNDFDDLIADRDTAWAGLTPLHSGTARVAGSPTTSQIQFDTAASSTDDFYNGTIVVITSLTGADQERIITDYTGSTRMADLDAPWVTAPDATSTFAVYPGRSSASVSSLGTGAITSSSFASGAITATAIAADAIGASELAADAATEIGTAVWASATRLLTAGTNIALAKGTGVTGFNDLSAAQVNAEADTAIADAALATAANLSALSARVPAALVSGRIDASVGAVANSAITAAAIASDAITSAKIATGAIDADALATDAVAELVTAVFDTTLTEVYSTLGGDVTLRQAIYELLQESQESVVTGTQRSILKRDQTTQAIRLDVDDADAVTTQTRGA